MGTLRPHPWHSQDGFSYRCEWGDQAIDAICDGAGAIVVVDVLRFSTAAAIASEWDAAVVPVSDRGSSTVASLRSADVRAAARSADADSPIRVWSPNGATVAAAALETGLPVYAGCLRNATATADAARAAAGGDPIAVIAAGERWPDGMLRPATEDLLGAGAVLQALDPDGSLTEPCCSPAARAARAAFVDARPLLLDLLTASASGRELWERGDGDDVREAARLDLSPGAARLVAP